MRAQAVIVPTSGDEGAAEFRYLASLVRLQFERAFPGSGVTLLQPLEDLGLVPPADLVVLVGSPRVLCTAVTLRAMADRIAGGAELVVPTQLAASGLPTSAPIYTLRGFERWEEAFVSRWGVEGGLPIDPLPLSMWRGDVFATRLAAVTLERMPAAVRALATELRVARAGLFHEFIDYYGEVREDVLPFLPADVHDVLEVGCARGLTGALIQERLGCRVTGVELNPVVAAQAAARLHRVVCGDVEEVVVEGAFDVVIALELFEHLVDPISFLRRVGGIVRPGGRVVLSTPNVGHWSIVRDLAEGRWDYLPIGLLCFSHLRFFTRRTLEDWIAMAGFERFRITPQRTELPSELEPWPSGFAVDRESLATKGFWVVVEP